MAEKKQLNYTVNEVNNILDKAEDITIPTKISELVNDIGYATTIFVNNAIANSESSSGGTVTSGDSNNSVKFFGAKGDGVTDDTQAIKQCFQYCTTNKKVMYFPNGTYILNEKLTKASTINESNADIPVYIEGESAYGVIINTTNETKPLIDVSRSKKVYIRNLTSENSWFHCVQYGDDFESFSKVRDVQLYNVISLCRDHSYPSWNVMINAPAPVNYSKEESDSLYNRYPLEIVSNSGYNSIMINNLANKGTDGTESYPSDNSSIGIIDMVKNASAAILVDCKTRSSFQVQNGDASITSAVRNNVVYEIDKAGHVAIGCSTQNGDSVAPGVGTMKLRDTNPSIYLYDSDNDNQKSVFKADGNIVSIGGYSSSGTFYGIRINCSTGEVSIEGTFKQ